MYSIWARFPKYVRDEVLKRKYEPVSVFGEMATKHLPRDYLGCCPLGVAFRVQGIDPQADAPGPGSVGIRLSEVFPGTAPAQIEDEARVFIADWDRGRVKDLKEALGV